MAFTPGANTPRKFGTGGNETILLQGSTGGVAADVPVSVRIGGVAATILRSSTTDSWSAEVRVPVLPVGNYTVEVTTVGGAVVAYPTQVSVVSGAWRFYLCRSDSYLDVACYGPGLTQANAPLYPATEQAAETPTHTNAGAIIASQVLKRNPGRYDGTTSVGPYSVLPGVYANVKAFIALHQTPRLYGLTSIGAGTWKFRAAARAFMNASYQTGHADRLCIYVWRPSTSSVVGYIFDNTGLAVGAGPLGNVGDATLRDMAFDFAGSAVNGIQDGDMIVVEWWARLTSTNANGGIQVRWGGLTDPGNVNGAASVGTDHAAYIEAPEDAFVTAVVDTIVPDHGPAFGLTDVTIDGEGFTSATGVEIGGAAATDVVVVSDTQITCRTARHAPGAAVDVVVLRPSGNVTLAAGYTYEDVLVMEPSHGPNAAAQRAVVRLYGVGEG